MNDDDRTLCRVRHSVRYSEFRTMPSKAAAARSSLGFFLNTRHKTPKTP
jgi:hypothetical protein